jgi:hypothetical protein
MTHSCNPSYSRGWDQEDWGSRVAQAISSQDSISKTKQNGLEVWLKQ